MSRLSNRIKIVLALIAAILIVAVPHVLTVDRGDSDVVIAGDVHPCSPLPDSQTFRIFVRNVPCSEGTDLATEVLDGGRCDQGKCTAGELDFKCSRTTRAKARLFWLCRTGGGEKVRFIIAGKTTG